jgi:hypothetical protein
MAGTFIEMVKGLLLNPVATFQQSRTDEPVAVFRYFITILLVNALLTAIVKTIEPEAIPVMNQMFFGVPYPVFVFFYVLISGLIITFLFSVWAHLGVFFLGGDKGILPTVKAVMYGNTPHLLLGWIPYIGMFFIFWSLVLGILGIRELQEMSTGKAILVIISAETVGVIIPWLLLLLIFANG